ncbi:MULTISPECIES: extracellular matrix/biofilm biosynthesis regulator RemA family protein [Petrotoga]|uniref:Uncharacterized protein n=2 Tax=Petrotoga sibirica TaxID=156202 RepID=A0A4R8EXM8_9BACT|nr:MULTISPECIES: extracellular matrix/biofilm biosynthesis regulator RemA family protein [Petrotoga]KUK82838.1 MAG: Uncharacterized protein XD96_0649 [Petrotoga mobilis]POZ88841.1 hypothetical protein AA80_04480 [Petrotoga sibirica DSM 13575]POZ90959.1 hypothetical protein AD60_05285 [Petrotoga sp. SL27]TDX17462.1 hypothetical protein C8D74_101182 [Petrotoga sibirica]
MFIAVGKGVFVPTERIHSVVPDSFVQFGKIKKIYQGIDVLTQFENETELENSPPPLNATVSLIDASYGKAVKSIIYMDSGQIVLTALESKKIVEKIKKGRR